MFLVSGAGNRIVLVGAGRHGNPRRTRAVPDSGECPHTAYGGALCAEFPATAVSGRNTNATLRGSGVGDRRKDRGHPQDPTRIAIGTKIRGGMRRRDESSFGPVRWHAHQGEPYY